MRTVAALCAGLALAGCTARPARRAAPPALAPTSAAPGPSAATRAQATAGPTVPVPTGTPSARPEPSPYAGWHLLWIFGGVPAAVTRRVKAVRDVAEVTPVRVSHVWVRSGVPGYPQVPVDTIAVEPAGFARAAGDGRLAAALRSGAVLSRTGAALRGARVGSTIRLVGGPAVRVSAIVDDVVVGGYELATDARRLGPGRPTYLLVRAPAAATAGVRRAVGSVPHRWRAPGERPWLRAADAVLPLGEVKQRFGEFAVRRVGGTLRPDPRWVARSIETRTVPVLGSVRCHRLVLDDLAAALAELQRRGQGRLLRRAEYAGCYFPRPVRGKDEVSRHSWGIAFDVNVGTNPLGGRPDMPRAVIEVLARHGFTWGGSWLRPDGGHFEWVGSA